MPNAGTGSPDRLLVNADTPVVLPATESTPAARPPPGRRPAADLNAVHTVDMSGRQRNGTWRLRVRDLYKGNAGHLDSWTPTV